MTASRVLIVGNFLSGHGNSRGVCEDLALRLRECGWTVLTTSSRRGRWARLADMLATAWLRRDDYDVAQVDVYSGPAFRWAEGVCQLFQRLGKPYILSLHGGALPEFSRSRAERVRGLLRGAAFVTVPSTYLLTQMKPYREDLTLLPNGLDLLAYRFRPRRPQPRLVWLRAFHQLYNPGMAIRVLHRLKKEVPSLSLTMTGGDKGDFSLQSVIADAERLDVQYLLTMQGAVKKEDVPAVLDGGDIFLNTSSVDNTPVSVLEAMASGLNIVSTDVGGLPFLLTSGKEAFLVPSDDDAAMANAVRRLLADQELAQKMQAASRTKVEEFAWEVVLPKWCSLLTSATGKPVAGTSIPLHLPAQIAKKSGLPGSPELHHRAP